MTVSHPEPRDIDHNDPGFITDPYPIYDALHAVDPVHHSAKYGGYFLVTKYDDVRRVLLDWETYSSGKPGVTSIPMSVDRSFPEIPLEVDPPDHRIYRAIVTPWFARRRVESLDKEVRTVATDLLDEMAGRTRADFVQELAAPLVSRVLAIFLNVPEEESIPWVGWMSDIFHGRLTDRERADAAGRKLIGYVDSKIETARRSPGKDFFSLLTRETFEGRPLSDEEIRGYGVLAMTAGQETTVNGIGNCLWHLGTDTEDRKRLIAHPTLIPMAIEEILRFLSPIQLLGRTAACDTELHGKQIPKGATVAVCYGAANRDRDVFSAADQCLIEREYNPHMAFGAGPHACLGAHLARLEMTVVVDEVLRRMPDYQVDTDAIELTPHGDLRGPWRLPIVLPG
jgi:cytochrome P450